ncbi:hypothetical protein GGH99_007633, partial [Coemansia sp. RSA 1285]
MDAAMVAKMTLDESASEARHPQQQQKEQQQKIQPHQQQQDDAYVQETSSSSSSTSSYSTTSSEVSSDSEHRGSGSAPPASTRSHTRPLPFLRSDRQLQKTSESPARPAAASGYTHDAGGLRRSSRKRAQRELLDTQSQP